MGQEETQPELTSVADGVREIRAELGAISRDLHSFHEEMTRLNERASAAGLKRLEYALTDADAKADRAEQSLDAACAELDLPPEAFEKGGGQA